MALSRRSITYEVQARRGARWEICARFDGDGRHQAVAQARAMNHHPQVAAVRVIKETYDPDGGAEEVIVYKSRTTARPHHPQPRADGRRRLPKPHGRFLGSPVPLGAFAVGVIKAILSSPQWAILPRAIFGTALAFFATVVATGVIAYMVNGGRPSVSSSSSSGDIGIAVAVFSCLFLFGAILVGFLLTSHRTADPKAPVKKRPRPPVAYRPPAPRPSTAAVPPPASTPAESWAPLSRSAEDLRDQLVNYLRQAIQPARGAYDLRDSFVRFGINLFVAGACQSLCGEHQIEAPTSSIIMAAGLRAVGVEANDAATLAKNYVEHLVSDRRHMTMFGRGREAIMTHLTNRIAAADLLLRALDEWVQGRPPKDDRNIVTIMFTRMAGFQEFVTSRGDEAARQAAHVHNEIVDRRLAEFRGKRIKHVEDGAMAAFTATADAVRAAHAIRADFDEQSRRLPERRLTLAIGLNCGEPIAEDNDLFGVSVQLAARIVGAAKPGQILVSEAVRKRLLTDAPTTAFTACGAFPLKGFSKPVPLYELTRI